MYARRSSKDFTAKDFKLRSLKQCVGYAIIKEIKCFELLRYGSY